MSKQNAIGGTSQDVIQKTARFATRTETLAGNLTLTALDPPIQFYDNGGAVRTITLPAEALSAGLMFFIKNRAGGAFAITVADDAAATIASLLQNEGAWLVCDGVTWEAIVGAET